MTIHDRTGPRYKHKVMNDQQARGSQRAAAPRTIVGGFGIYPLEPVANGYNPYVVAWVVNDYRRDKRTGPISQQPRSPYGQELLEAVFRKWR